jgi:hypothetical protein
MSKFDKVADKVLDAVTDSLDRIKSTRSGFEYAIAYIVACFVIPAFLVIAFAGVASAIVVFIIVNISAFLIPMLLFVGFGLYLLFTNVPTED